MSEALQLDGYFKPLKKVLDLKYPDIEQADLTAEYNQQAAYVRYDRLFHALNDSNMINEVPRFQNLGDTKSNLMLIKALAQFISQKPCRMNAKAIRRGLNAYRLTCSGEPNAQSVYENRVKNLALDANLLHRCLKLAGVTMSTDQIQFWINEMLRMKKFNF